MLTGKLLSRVQNTSDQMNAIEEQSENHSQCEQEDCDDEEAHEKAESDHHSEHIEGGAYGEKIDHVGRLLRKIEKEKQIVQDREQKLLCGPRIMKRVDDMMTGFLNSKEEIFAQMLKSGNTSLFNSQMIANSN